MPHRSGNLPDYDFSPRSGCLKQKHWSYKDLSIRCLPWPWGLSNQLTDKGIQFVMKLDYEIGDSCRIQKSCQSFELMSECNSYLNRHNLVDVSEIVGSKMLFLILPNLPVNSSHSEPDSPDAVFVVHPVERLG